jgi:hypothetical protein
VVAALDEHILLLLALEQTELSVIISGILRKALHFVIHYKNNIKLQDHFLFFLSHC